MARSALALAFWFVVPVSLFAQHTHDHAAAGASAQPAAPASAAGSGSRDWKQDAMARHMAYSSSRPLTVADSVRAAQVINELRQAVARYQDVRVAEADGYRMFAPQVKNQPQYHFTRNWNAMRNQFGFDPARPTSLLYKRNEQGELVLVGAMYTASKRTSEEELDKRVPLSVARWHRHVNWCIPRRSQKDRWYELKDGRPVFGPLGVSTEEECKAAEGRFIPQAFGWMVHANVFAGNDLRSIWHDDHMEHDHDAMLGTPKGP
ncbi:MAG TPA: hypothetical protein VJZ25_00035 [Gemmatimonadaceae bacterium]|nr:hypothetical protein [Gemmatimonadaceae bacterium]